MRAGAILLSVDARDAEPLLFPCYLELGVPVVIVDDRQLHSFYVSRGWVFSCFRIRFLCARANCLAHLSAAFFLRTTHSVPGQSVSFLVQIRTLASAGFVSEQHSLSTTARPCSATALQ